MSDDWFSKDDESVDEEEDQVSNKTDRPSFTMDEAEEQPKIVITCAGEKGEGKTMTALSFIRKDKRIAAIQFDEKTAPIKKYFYKSTDRIKVYSGTKHWVPTPERITETGYKSIQYIQFVLERLADLPKAERPHYVVIDGFEVTTMIAEMAMRYNNKIKPFAGVKNRNVWKERRVYLKSIHNLSIQAALEGVIYTVYMEQRDSVIKDGEVQERKTEPKWLDVIKLETDITLHCFKGIKDHKPIFVVEVMNSKIPSLFKTGSKYDVTDKPLMLGNINEIFGTVKESSSTAQKQAKDDPKPSEDTDISKTEEEIEDTEEEVKEVKEVKEKPKKNRRGRPKKEAKPDHDSDTIKEEENVDNSEVVSELAEIQAKFAKESEQANEEVKEKMVAEGKIVIVECLRDDFDGAAPIKKLQDKVVDDGVITPQSFKLSLSALMEDDEIFEHRLGHVKLLDSEDHEDINDEKHEDIEDNVTDDPNSDSDEDESEDDEILDW